MILDQGFGTIDQTHMQSVQLDVHCKQCQQYHLEEPCRKLLLLQALQSFKYLKTSQARLEGTTLCVAYRVLLHQICPNISNPVE
jgi:hypothetical protein